MGEEKYAIMDDNGVMYEGDYEAIMEIWNNEEYREMVDRKGSITLVKILERRNTPIRDAVDKRIHIEEEIREMLRQLPNWNKRCTCDKSEIVLFLEDTPTFPEVKAYCIKCGGEVEI